jgi:hypothetical protein
MEAQTTVLLAGEGMKVALHLQNNLRTRGCQLTFAPSPAAAAATVANGHFDIVLSEAKPEVGGTSRLIASLLGSRSHLFCSVAVEDGCWWLPAVRWGQNCLGVPAIPCRDFAAVLDQLLSEIQSCRNAEDNRLEYAQASHA